MEHIEHVKRKKETNRIVFLRMDVFSFFFFLSSVRSASISPTSLTWNNQQAKLKPFPIKI